MKLGIISDTHNLLRPEVLSALSNVDTILHAGDISSQEILDQLQSIATIYAVRGNADKEWATHLPDFQPGEWFVGDVRDKETLEKFSKYVIERSDRVH